MTTTMCSISGMSFVPTGRRGSGRSPARRGATTGVVVFGPTVGAMPAGRVVTGRARPWWLLLHASSATAADSARKPRRLIDTTSEVTPGPSCHGSSACTPRDDGRMTSQYDELLLDAYRGEVFGEAFFGAMLDGALGAQHAEALAALRDVEAQTAARLQPRVDVHALSYAGDPIGEGKQLGVAASDGAWNDFLT